jgi:hypothetical protein
VSYENGDFLRGKLREVEQKNRSRQFGIACEDGRFDDLTFRLVEGHIGFKMLIHRNQGCDLSRVVGQSFTNSKVRLKKPQQLSKTAVMTSGKIVMAFSARRQRTASVKTHRHGAARFEPRPAWQDKLF